MLFVFVLFLRAFFFNDTATTEIYTLSLHDALPIGRAACEPACLRRSPLEGRRCGRRVVRGKARLEEPLADADLALEGGIVAEERRPQIVHELRRRHGSEGVPVEIRSEPGVEALTTEVRFEHAQKRSTLAVWHRREGFVGVAPLHV